MDPAGRRLREGGWEIFARFIKKRPRARVTIGNELAY
jgi:hypothetical protein